LSDLAKYSMTRSVAWSLCDSWASRFLFHAPCIRGPRWGVSVGILPSRMVWTI